MKRSIAGIIGSLMLVNITYGQDRGIRFEQGLSWQQMVEKARVENKYIFIDCFTTWCGPCKAMERDVYPLEKVGDTFNKRFISIKVQIDSTNGDNDIVRSWYQQAHMIIEKYKIEGFPTYLFFSPDGQIVHRGLGYRNADDLIALAGEALNPQRQCYTLLQQYQSGKKDYPSMPWLVNIARDFDKKRAEIIANDYIDNYLFKESSQNVFTRDNIDFIGSLVASSKDSSFKLFYLHEKEIDDIMRKRGYVSQIIDPIISKEEIMPEVKASRKNGKTPDWHNIRKTIKKKFNANYADRNILDARVDWYERLRKWKQYTKYVVKRVEKFGVDTSDLSGDIFLNNIAWLGIFFHSNKPAEIKSALRWQEGVIRRNPKSENFLDTYANLLYKLGKVDQAIAIEERASEMAPQVKAIRETVARMKNHEVTWPTN